MVRQLVTLRGRNVSVEVDIHEGSRTSSKAHEVLSDSSESNRKVLLVLHPWPWLGGCMDDQVVLAVCRAAMASGKFTTVARYNMRGTGDSSGSRALVPSVDAADLVALVHHLLQLPPTANGSNPTPTPRPRLFLAAYSYGSVVASRALEELRPHLAAFAAIAFPLGAICRFLLGSGPAWEALAAAHTLPRLLCSGDRDQFADASRLAAAVHKAQAGEQRRSIAATSTATAAAVPPTPTSAAASSLELVLWPGCDHFFNCSNPMALAATGLLSDHIAVQGASMTSPAPYDSTPHGDGVAGTAPAGSLASGKYKREQRQGGGEGPMGRGGQAGIQGRASTGAAISPIGRPNDIWMTFSDEGGSNSLRIRSPSSTENSLQRSASGEGDGGRRSAARAGSGFGGAVGLGEGGGRAGRRQRSISPVTALGTYVVGWLAAVVSYNA